MAGKGRLAAALDAPGVIKEKGGTCSIAAVLAKLDKTDRATLLAWLADPTMEAATIHRALVSIGFKVGDSTVRRHRRGNCGCGGST